MNLDDSLRDAREDLAAVAIDVPGFPRLLRRSRQRRWAVATTVLALVAILAAASVGALAGGRSTQRVVSGPTQRSGPIVPWRPISPLPMSRRMTLGSRSAYSTAEVKHLVREWSALDYTPIDVPHQVKAGGLLAFVVIVGNPTSHAIKLDACPFYEVSLDMAGSRQANEQEVLNCTVAPLIPAGGSVWYAMRLAVPSSIPAGVASLVWSPTSEGERVGGSSSSQDLSRLTHAIDGLSSEASKLHAEIVAAVEPARRQLEHELATLEAEQRQDQAQLGRERVLAQADNRAERINDTATTHADFDAPIAQLSAQIASLKARHRPTDTTLTQELGLLKLTQMEWSMQDIVSAAQDTGDYGLGLRILQGRLDAIDQAEATLESEIIGATDPTVQERLVRRFAQLQSADSGPRGLLNDTISELQQQRAVVRQHPQIAPRQPLPTVRVLRR